MLLLAVLMHACQGPTEPEDSALITLHCEEGCNFKVKVSRLDTSLIVPLDSLMLKTGQTAKFDIPVKEPGFYLITYPESGRRLVVLHPGDNLKGKITAHSGIIFSGGVENDYYQQFVFFLDTLRLKTDSLIAVLDAARYTGNYAEQLKFFDSTLLTFRQQARTKAIQYLQQHPQALSQILVMNALPAQQALFMGLADSSWFYYTDSTLGVYFPDNEHRLMHHNRVQHLRQLARAENQAKKQLQQGSFAPEISLPDFSDRIKSWHSLKGKPVLLYFWAPVDAPSRQTNAKLKQIFEDKSLPSFNVYAIAFDELPDRWKAAVNLDKIWWTNVIDTLGERSPLRRQYLIKRLPVMILLDEQGRIKQRFLSADAFKTYLENQRQ
ncbi:MAG: TlpA disulfide reductase family protein [Lentimicrobiaceae bacterium]|nr:TlpA disulfide reductase family protein [Lentimicrobiaceae bacterium]